MVPKDVLAARQRAANATLKAEGGPRYEAWKAAKRQQKAASRGLIGRMPYDLRGNSQRGRQGRLLQKARRRARDQGRVFTIVWRDVEWPTHCPVFGIELNYMGTIASKTCGDAAASLDRRDNALGYIPGNVIVISARANRLKGDGTITEFEKLIAYMRYP